MKKFFDVFGGRKNFNYYLIVAVGFVLVLLDRLAGDAYFTAILAGGIGYSYFNLKEKKYDIIQKNNEEESSV